MDKKAAHNFENAQTWFLLPAADLEDQTSAVLSKKIKIEHIHGVL